MGREEPAGAVEDHLRGALRIVAIVADVDELHGHGPERLHLGEGLEGARGLHAAVERDHHLFHSPVLLVHHQRRRGGGLDDLRQHVRPRLRRRIVVMRRPPDDEQVVVLRVLDDLRRRVPRIDVVVGVGHAGRIHLLAEGCEELARFAEDLLREGLAELLGVVHRADAAASSVLAEGGLVDEGEPRHGAVVALGDLSGVAGGYRRVGIGVEGYEQALDHRGGGSVSGGARSPGGRGGRN